MGLGLFGGGLGAARFCVARGARVTVTDLRSAEELGPSLDELAGADLALRLGGHDEDDFTGADLVVASPAVPPASTYLAAARAAGVPVITEITLFLSHCAAECVLGITGSNGKTTTTAMTGEILSRLGRTHVGGNIGRSLLPSVDDIRPGDFVVLELSSFQLEYVREQAGPLTVAALLNLTPNHLDRHGTLEDYARAKAGIFVRQDPTHTAVLNADDPRTRDLGAELPSRVVHFSLDENLAEGFLLRGDVLVRREGGKDEEILPSEALGLRGRFNRANALAAAACAHSAGADTARIAEGLRAFRAVPHRLEPVGEVRGIRFFNDSVATTPESTVAALRSFEEPLVLIAGGYDKGLPLEILAREIGTAGAGLVVLGPVGEKLAGLADPAGDVVRASDMEEAVDRAFERARPGGVVLLSPGAASYDMFLNFQQRGEAFRRAVRRLQEAVGREEESP
jgi:UDP-N-acetylmuramoylalanine--D-glutamate ligase